MLLWAISTAYARDGFQPVSVDRVAMIAFSGSNAIVLPNTEGIVGSVKAVGDALELPTAAEDEAARAVAEANGARAYDVVRDGYAAAFGWTLPTREALAENPAVARAEQDYPNSRHPVGDLAQALIAPGLFSESGWWRMPLSERDAMMDALGVDAVVLSAVSASGEAGSVSVLGFGHAWVKPRCSLYTVVYIRGEEHPMWQRVFYGPRTMHSVKSTLGSRPDTTPALFEALDAGLAKFEAKYQKKYAD